MDGPLLMKTCKQSTVFSDENSEKRRIIFQQDYIFIHAYMDSSL